jgi:diguanylate cyclase (GGDEF)-like protein
MHKRAAGAIRWAAILLAIAVPGVAAVERVDGPPQTVRDEFLWRVYRSFGTAEGLPHPEVNALVQDRVGLVYAGTGEGLARYDGVAWETLPLAEAEAPAVRALLVDGDGAVLVGTEGRGLWRLDAATRAAQAVRHPAMGRTVLDLVPAADGGYWVASDGDLLHCRGADCAPLAAARGLPVYRVWSGRWRGQPLLWLGLDGAGVRRIDDPLGPAPRLSDFRIDRDDGLPNNSVRALVQWGGVDGEDLWIGSGRGVARWNGERLAVYSAGNGFPVAMVFAFQPATSISGRSQLYAALRPGGLATFRDDGTWILQDIATGLPSNDVQSMLISTTGSSRRTLWVGTIDAGIARRDPGQFTLLDERIGIPSRHVYGLGRVRFGDGIESPWVGTVKGARRWVRGAWQPFMPSGYGERVVRDLVAGDDGRLWAGTDRQLLAFDARGVREFSADNSALPAVGVYRLARLGHGASQQIWVATGHGLARHDAAQGLVSGDWGEGAIPGQASILSLVEEPALTRVWVGLADGLAAIDAAGVRRVDAPCLDGEAVHDIAPIDARQVFVATRTRLLRLDPRDPRACLPVRLAEDTGVIGGLLVDGSARLYVFSSRVVQRLAIAGIGGDGAVALERFDRGDGLQSPQLRAGRNLWLDSENRLYAATAAGLAAFEPEPNLAETAPARLYLTKAERADGQPLRDGDVLPADANAVRFDYRLLSFEREQRIRYHTELRGLAGSAGAWGAAASRRFDRLPAGNYVFVVRARSADGRETEPLQLRFSVLAPWWLRTWALSMFALMLVASGIAFGRWRAAATARRARELERVVAERTQALAEANVRLERASLTDPLTGLGNRRHFALATEGELARALRRLQAGESHAHLLLMMIDLDHFKRINDTQGHANGDRVLAALARRIDAFARAGDVVARFGGEEFVLLARDIAAADAAPLLRRCLHAIADAPVELEGRALPITASIGAVLLPGRLAGDSLEAALSVADDALYTAKQAGRDLACLVAADGDERSLAGRPVRLLARA